MANILTARFISSVAELAKCPPPKLPEYAFIGRSNVGKSSLINMLTQQKGLAKVSASPGKTQTINHFLIDECWYLADLPGYGYAKVSKKKRGMWLGMIDSYIKGRESLLNTFILIDSRLPLQKIDAEFMAFMATNELPFSIVFTKTDKMGVNKLTSSISTWEQQLLAEWEELPQRFITSAVEGTGRNEILDFIKKTNKLLPL